MAATKKQIDEALHEARHYLTLAEEAREDGLLEDAQGWLEALREEVATALGRDVA